MKKLIYVLKWYYLDCSSYKIIDVESYTFDDLDKCKEYLKRKAYEIYVDNEGDDVSFEDWEFELYDNYEYEIEETPKRVVSIEDLEHMIEDAIRNEEYEIAAEIRDRIEKLKKEGN